MKIYTQRTLSAFVLFPMKDETPCIRSVPTSTISYTQTDSQSNRQIDRDAKRSARGFCTSIVHVRTTYHCVLDNQWVQSLYVGTLSLFVCQLISYFSPVYITAKYVRATCKLLRRYIPIHSNADLVSLVLFENPQ